MRGEKEKMLAGEWFDPHDAELTADRDRATRLMHRLNVECCGHGDDYRTTLGELCPNVRGFIREPFHCDYGYNIHMGEGSFVNFDCVFLDLAPIRIGCGTLIGPKVQLLTAHHPFDAATRDGPRSRQAHRHRRPLLAGRRSDRMPGRHDRRQGGRRGRVGRHTRYPRGFGRSRQPCTYHPPALNIPRHPIAPCSHPTPLISNP